MMKNRNEKIGIGYRNAGVGVQSLERLLLISISIAKALFYRTNCLFIYCTKTDDAHTELTSASAR